MPTDDHPPLYNGPELEIVAIGVANSAPECLKWIRFLQQGGKVALFLAVSTFLDVRLSRTCRHLDPNQ